MNVTFGHRRIQVAASRVVVSCRQARPVPSARQPSTTASVPSALTLTSGSTGATAVARDLLERLAEEVTVMALTAMARLNLTGPGALGAPVILGGGLLGLDCLGAAPDAEYRLRAAMVAGLPGYLAKQAARWSFTRPQACIVA
jgi:hypothetical protein